MENNNDTKALEQLNQTLMRAQKNNLVLNHILTNSEVLDIFETIENASPQQANLALETFYNFKSLAAQRAEGRWFPDEWHSEFREIEEKEIPVVSGIITKAWQHGVPVDSKYEENLQNRINQIRIDKYGEWLEIPNERTDGSIETGQYGIQSFKKDWLANMERRIQENPEEKEAAMLPTILLCRKWKKTVDSLTHEELYGPKEERFNADLKKFHHPDQPVDMKSYLEGGTMALAKVLTSTSKGELSEKTIRLLEELSVPHENSRHAALCMKMGFARYEENSDKQVKTPEEIKLSDILTKQYLNNKRVNG